jgi:hypothetical protein
MTDLKDDNTGIPLDCKVESSARKGRVICDSFLTAPLTTLIP